MDRVYAASDKPVREINGAAVFVAQSRRHIGLAYETATGAGHLEIHLLHLGWHGHNHFHNDTDTSHCTYWIDPDVEPEQSEVIAAHCRLIFERNMDNGIPYGFGSPDGFFGTDGDALPAGASLGLTCATFVLAVFHLSGLPLVKYDTWISRDDDRIESLTR